MNLQCSISKRVKTAQGWRYCPVVISGNSRVQKDVVLVDGKEETHTEGAYYVCWREGKKLRRERMANAQDAARRREKRQNDMDAAAKGVAVVPDTLRGPSLTDAVAKYLARVKLRLKPRSFSAYKTALEYFTESCHCGTVQNITGDDMADFAAYLRDVKKQSPRSCYNKFELVMGFLKGQGVKGIVGKEDWPRFVEEEPEIYEKEDVAALLAACEPLEKLWWNFFLCTGFREQEVIYVTWRDVNFRHCTVSVKHKPEYGWTPKAYRERTVPIPGWLADALKAHKATAKDCPLVFHTDGCRPKKDFLHCLKACARRAGLDEREYWLHRFRSSFATWSLWNGVDFRTMQMWMGHKDIESTMRYLKPSRSPETQAKANTTFVQPS